MGWDYGHEILWCYRREALPCRIVQDDGEWLVAWVAPGTELLTSVPADGRGLRDRPPAERFTCERVFELSEWFGAGVLRVARRDEAHSSWLFRRPDDHEQFWGWYGNLEKPLRRSELGVHTIDHILDVWVDAEGRVRWKDEDELDAIVGVGRFTNQHAAAIRAEGERVYAAMERRDPPYDGSWLDWRPDASWPTPALPDEYRAHVGQPVYDLFPEFI